MTRARTYTALSAMLIMLFVSSGAFAEKPAAPAETKEAEALAAPGEVIDSVTTSLLNLVKEKESLVKSEPEAYFAELRSLLENAIDFKSIAKNVMGKKSWLAVEEKDQAQFVNVFADSLVRTYGKAMSSFADLDIEVVKTWPSENPKKKTYFVQQDVKLEGGLAHIVYSMSPVADGWKVRNVTIRDSKGYKLNMGKTFYSQFQYALSENDGDVKATIASWGKE